METGAQETKPQETKPQEVKPQQARQQEVKPQQVKPQEAKAQEAKAQETIRQDTRIPLKEGMLLHVTNSQGGRITYKIRQEIGRGSSSLVYLGHYRNNSGAMKPVRVKECYPFRQNILRKDSGELAAYAGDEAAFEACKARMKEAYAVSDGLFQAEELTNSISNSIDIYETNNTIYVITTYLEGEVLSPGLFSSLKEAAAFVKSTAETLRKVHDRGYLYLDLKPENIFVPKNVTELPVLFDFDSLIPLEGQPEAGGRELRCTKGFSALEQKTGRWSQIGKHTDVYGVGALLFYVVFERVPDAFDCDIDVIYDYTKSRYGSSFYRDRLYYELTDFFHNTLSAFWQDRYPDLTEAVRQLAVIEGLADLTKPFICDSYIPDRVFLTGREKEEKLLGQWLSDNRKKCLFVTGMGGIGKSTLVRGCIAGNRENFDTVLYLYYHGSLPGTMGDDSQLLVNTLQRMREESETDYFRRKMHCLRQIAAGTRVLLVIDNFDGKPGEDFLDILQLGWKVIVITRNEAGAVEKEYETIKLEAIQEPEGLYELIAVNMGREIRQEEKIWLNRIIEGLHGHTLALELLAKQIAKSYLAIPEAALLAEKHGFTGVASEKVEYVKDGKLYYEKISGIITALYSAGQMCMQKRVLLRMLALFEMPGVEMQVFLAMADQPSLDLINELQQEGWIQIEQIQAGYYLSLHPVIRESVRKWQWEDDYKKSAERVMLYICIALWMEGMREEYPVKFRSFFQELGQQEKALGSGSFENYRYYLQLAESVLESLRKDGNLNDTEPYRDLLYCTILNMPRDRDDFIISRSEELLQEPEWMNPEDHKGNDAAEQQEDIIALYDYVVFVHCEKAEYEQAYNKIIQAEKRIEKLRNHHLRGLFYAMLAQYYDELLNGAYIVCSKEERTICHKMMRAAEYSVRHMRKSGKPESKQYLTRYLLENATFLIRSDSKRIKKVKRLMHQARVLMEKYVPEYSEIRQSYYLTRAWYYTLLEPDIELTAKALEAALDIVEKRVCPELDLIDFMIVPLADILLVWEEWESAALWLKKGIEICDRYSVSLPYIRKKMELYMHLMDVYCCKGDFEQGHGVLRIIDRENRQNEWTGIEAEISEEVRHWIQEHNVSADTDMIDIR